MKEIIKQIKIIHKNVVCLFKIGKFYHCYNREAYILCYLFNYRLKCIEKDFFECGFPEASLNKIIAKLEEKKINYSIIDKRNDYDEDKTCNFKNLNNYDKFYQKARNFVNYRFRIETINNYLLENIDKQDFRKILGRIEEVINEGRKI